MLYSSALCPTLPSRICSLPMLYESPLCSAFARQDVTSLCLRPSSLNYAVALLNQTVPLLYLTKQCLNKTHPRITSAEPVTTSPMLNVSAPHLSLPTLYFTMPLPNASLPHFAIAQRFHASHCLYISSPCQCYAYLCNSFAFRITSALCHYYAIRTHPLLIWCMHILRYALPCETATSTIAPLTDTVELSEVKPIFHV